jgi:hypothetical protein
VYPLPIPKKYGAPVVYEGPPSTLILIALDIDDS